MSKFTLSGFSDEIDEKIVVQFEHLNKLGISYFEPRGINGVNISDIDDTQLDELKQNMKKYGIKVSSIGSPIGKIGINDTFEPHLEKLKRVISILQKNLIQNTYVSSAFSSRKTKTPQNTAMRSCQE